MEAWTGARAIEREPRPVPRWRFGRVVPLDKVESCFTSGGGARSAFSTMRDSSVFYITSARQDDSQHTMVQATIHRFPRV